MRYVFGFLCVCALGLVPLVGCGEKQEADPCLEDWQCDDGEFCISGVCGENPCDDDNECTRDYYRPDGSCDYVQIPIGTPLGTPCDWNGEPGVCINGVCEEDPCKGVVCDDGDLCTNDRCVRTTGECAFGPVGCSDRNTCTDDTCDPDSGGCDYTPVPDGQPCCYRGHWKCCELLCFSQCYVCDVAGYCDSGACIE